MNDTKLFEGIIGQEKAKKELGFYLNSYLKTRIFPNLMFVAAKGQGKTTLAKETAKGLHLFDEEGTLVINDTTGKFKRKPFVEVNCSTLKNVKQFINGLIIPYVQDKDVTLLFDEASEIPRDVTMALLTILNPNPENRTTFALEEYVCDFDFRRQTFLFATSEPNQVFHALMDRLERITLQDYTLDQLGKIVHKGLPNVEFEDGVLAQIATVLRGNARAGQKMASKIAAYLKGSDVFMMEDWEALKDTLSIAPLGLNQIEISILRYLAQNGNGTSLTCLSAKTGMSRESLQKDAELYLQKHSLMEITTTGRMITAAGLDYLKHLDRTPVASCKVAA